jgi:riboflavin biosynthesis pyrimidine reductase
MIVSARGEIDLERGLLFNVPHVPVFVLAGNACLDRCGPAFAQRPWITVAPLEPEGLPAALGRLCRDHGITRISAIGGRSTASSLIDAGLVQDICLTTTIRAAGEPNTPFYTGQAPPHFALIVRKVGTDPSYPILVEHSAIRDERAGDT